MSIRDRRSARRERRAVAAEARAARLRHGSNLRAPALWATVVQALAFVRKELVEILRQPKLLVLLVLGPFVLLLFFGAGYQDTTIRLRTELIGPPGSMYEEAIADYADELEAYVDLRGFGSDEEAARRRLVDGQIDAVVIFPPDALESILAGRSAEITVLHQALDPVEQVAIDISSQLAVQEVNSAVLGTIAASTQQALAPVNETASAMAEHAAALTTAAAEGDTGAVRDTAGVAGDTLAGARLVVATSQQVIQQLEDGPTPELDDLLGRLEAAEAEADAVRAGDAGDASEHAAALASSLTAASEAISSVTTVDPAVLVRPFQAITENVAPTRVGPSDYFTPAAIILLLQHLAITFAALSLVRDRELGLFELLRVGPLSSVEILAGKTIAYLTIGLGVGAVLIGAAVLALGTPMLGDVGWVAATVVLVLLASLALGMVLSMIAGSETQAVQYAMLTLLAGMFFSGFILDVSQLATPYRYLSYVLPVTYGNGLVRDIMLRGIPAKPSDLIGLGALVVTYGSVAVVLLHRRLRIG